MCCQVSSSAAKQLWGKAFLKALIIMIKSSLPDNHTELPFPFIPSVSLVLSHASKPVLPHQIQQGHGIPLMDKSISESPLFIEQFEFRHKPM